MCCPAELCDVTVRGTLPLIMSQFPTQTLFCLVNEFLKSRDIQEADALCDGVEQQEAVCPADGGLQRSHRALLAEII